LSSGTRLSISVVLPLSLLPTMAISAGLGHLPSRGRGGLLEAAPRALEVLRRVHGPEWLGAGEGHRDDPEVGEDVDDAVASALEEPAHGGQTAGTVDGVQRLQLVVHDRHGHVGAAEGFEQVGYGPLVGKGDVDGEHEQGRPETLEGGGDAGQWRPLVVVDEHLRQTAQRQFHPLALAQRDRDGGKELLKEGEVAFEQGVPSEAQLALVAAHAPRPASCEQESDRHCFAFAAVRGHRGVVYPRPSVCSLC
jgi:hypothetical protein